MEVAFGLRPVVHGHLVQVGGEQTGVGDGGEAGRGELQARDLDAACVGNYLVERA
ncbi:hypothetical protein ACW4TU_00170 [Streptomyces sp. QTS52]